MDSMKNENPYSEEFDENPFRAPEEFAGGTLAASGQVEAIRNEYLSHEASVKSVGLLYMIGGVIVLIGSMGILLLVKDIPRGRAQLNSGIIVLMPVLGGIQIFTAVGLRRLRAWARIPSGILSAIGLIGFPIGTLINGYILYLLFSPKGAMVFSDEYHEVMAQTPHIKYKTSIVVWIFLVLLLTIIAFGVIAAFAG